LALTFLQALFQKSLQHLRGKQYPLDKPNKLVSRTLDGYYPDTFVNTYFECHEQFFFQNVRKTRWRWGHVVL